MKTLRIVAAAAVIALACGGAAAQTTLRIGLAEDPDILDPTLARTYVGRIVFASICDKLFDIDEKLNVVPQLALAHETSADGKTVTIRLRPGVKFHDGEPLDAEAAKFSLERHLTMPGSFRKPELAAVDHIEVVDPLTIRIVLKTPYSPLIAQLTDRAGMMVSPKAARQEGDRFGLKPVCAGPYRFVERVQQDRIVVEKFADYWNKDNVHIDRIVYLPIVDATVRLANLKSGGLDSHRAHARDRHQGRARRSPSSASRPRSSSATRASPSTWATTSAPRRRRSAASPRCARRSASRSIARRSTRSCSTASSCPATSGSVPSIPISRKAFRCPEARSSPRPRR